MSIRNISKKIKHQEFNILSVFNNILVKAQMIDMNGIG